MDIQSLGPQETLHLPLGRAFGFLWLLKMLKNLGLYMLPSADQCELFGPVVRSQSIPGGKGISATSPLFPLTAFS